MEIETRTASLETFAVTIRALHVNGKQMTLAVFRQLPMGYEEDDDDLWGLVRYTIKDAGNVWAVFSHQGRLYRRAIQTRPNYEYGRRVRHAHDDLLRIENSFREYKKRTTDALARNSESVYLKMTPERRAALEQELAEKTAAYEREAQGARRYEADRQKDADQEDDRAAYDMRLTMILPQLFIAV